MLLPEDTIGRPVSRLEALSAAKQALEEAERERLEAAEREARLGVQWGAGEQSLQVQINASS